MSVQEHETREEIIAFWLQWKQESNSLELDLERTQPLPVLEIENRGRTWPGV
jgi:hypothetical protein